MVAIEREDVTEIGPGGAVNRRLNERPNSTTERGVMKVGYDDAKLPLPGVPKAEGP